MYEELDMSFLSSNISSIASVICKLETQFTQKYENLARTGDPLSVPYFETLYQISYQSNMIYNLCLQQL